MTATSTRHLLLYYTDAMVAVTVTVPAACPATITDAQQRFEWSFAPGTQLSYRMDFYSDAAGTVLAYSTGIITSANKFHDMVGGELAEDSVFYFTVSVWLTDGDSGVSALCQITTNFNPINEVTGMVIQCIDACDVPTLLPRVKITWDQVVPAGAEVFVRYDVRRRENADPWITIAQITAIGTLEYEDATPQSYTPYLYSVRWVATDGADTLVSVGTAAAGCRLEFEFNWLHLLGGDSISQSVRLDSHDIDMSVIADVTTRAVAGRQEPSSFVGEQFSQRLLVPALGRHFSDLPWWDKLLELIELQQTSSNPLVFRMGRMRQRYFVAALGTQRRNSQKGYSADVQLAEVFHEEDLDA